MGVVIKEIKKLGSLGVPVLFTQIGVMVVSFADTIMVGAYGTSELAAAAFVNNLFMAAIVMLIGFAAGLTPILGALYTKGEGYNAGRMLGAGLRINAVLTVVFTVVMGVVYFFLDSMGQPEELLSLIREYYLIMLLTVLPAGVFNACQQMANSVNNTSLPMWVILGANALNIFGNWMLIFGNLGMPELGLAGAGWSTVIARWGACVAIMLCIMHGRRYAPYKEGLMKGKSTRDERKKIITTSLPVMLQNGAEAAAWSFGAVVSGWFGAVQLAAYQVTTTMSQIGFMTYLSFSTAVAIRVANKMGEKDYGGLRPSAYTCLGINIFLSVLASCVFVFFGKSVFHIFTPDERVITTSMTLILPLVLYQIFDAVQVTMSNALRGTGFVQPLLWTSVGAYMIIGVPVMLWFASGLELASVGVYYSYTVMLVIASVSYWWFFRRRVSRLLV